MTTHSPTNRSLLISVITALMSIPALGKTAVREPFFHYLHDDDSNDRVGWNKKALSSMVGEKILGVCGKNLNPLRVSMSKNEKSECGKYYLRASCKENETILVYGIDGLKKGPIESFFVKGQFGKKTWTYRFKESQLKWEIKTEGTYQSFHFQEGMSGKSKRGNLLKDHVLLKYDGKKHPDIGMVFQPLWVGDINRDGKADFVFVLQTRIYESNTVLFLSGSDDYRALEAPRRACI